MPKTLHKLVPYIGIAILLLSPLCVSAQSAPIGIQDAAPDTSSLAVADNQFLASLSSFFVNLLGGIRLFGGVSLGSILARSPQAAVPYLYPGSGWTGATAQPATQGTPGTGYNDDAIADWDAVPFATLMSTTPVCVAAFHNQGISSVAFAVDGGTWVNVSTLSTNPVDGASEYCADINPASFPDGLHEVRAIVYPNTGVPRVLASQVDASVTNGSPLVSQAANGLTPGKQVVFSGSVPGAKLESG